MYLLFQIGDKIVYPMHGASVIEAIEEKEILGEKRLYYVIKTTFGNTQIMIPVDNTENLGVRQVVEADILENLLENFNETEADTSVNPLHRHRINMTKMKSGDIHQAAEVINDLMHLNKNKKLGTSDKKMLDHAREILISELMMVKGMVEEQATHLLNEATDYR
ncbi:CarD family transcriptional regulator [Bacillus taeanensis]|uniref:CarD family transcriptional regulator n=1 Tax=Bacillus taeanensis TaxID=273032 RepID=UPI00319E849B